MTEERKHAILLAATILCARKMMPMLEEDTPNMAQESSGRDLADAAEKIESAQLSYRQAKVAPKAEETASAESVTLQ